jgi:hypothetical protein
MKVHVAFITQAYEAPIMIGVYNYAHLAHGALAEVLAEPCNYGWLGEVKTRELIISTEEMIDNLSIEKLIRL